MHSLGVLRAEPDPPFPRLFFEPELDDGRRTTTTVKATSMAARSSKLSAAGRPAGARPGQQARRLVATQGRLLPLFLSLTPILSFFLRRCRDPSLAEGDGRPAERRRS